MINTSTVSIHLTTKKLIKELKSEIQKCENRISKANKESEQFPDIYDDNKAMIKTLNESLNQQQAILSFLDSLTFVANLRGDSTDIESYDIDVFYRPRDERYYFIDEGYVIWCSPKQLKQYIKNSGMQDYFKEIKSMALKSHDEIAKIGVLLHDYFTARQLNKLEDFLTRKYSSRGFSLITFDLLEMMGKQ